MRRSDNLNRNSKEGWLKYNADSPVDYLKLLLPERKEAVERIRETLYFSVRQLTQETGSWGLHSGLYPGYGFRTQLQFQGSG
jgi:hypothetical protein